MKRIQKLFLVTMGAILLAANADAGRWITRDPIEHMERDPQPMQLNYREQANLYLFVLNDPVNHVDPFGLNAILTTWSEPIYNNSGDVMGHFTVWIGDISKAPPDMPLRIWEGNIGTLPQWMEPEMGLQSSFLGDMLLGGFAGSLRGAAPCTVSRWGRPGLQPDDWVMTGRPNLWNYGLSGKWQPGLGNQFAAPWRGEAFFVNPASLKWPTGWGIDGRWKGLFGQRIYQP